MGESIQLSGINLYKILVGDYPGVAQVLNYPNPLSHQQHTSTNFYTYIKDYTTAII
jgi:hypothetical protein